MNLHSSISIQDDQIDKYEGVIDDGIIHATQLSSAEAILISAIKELSAKLDSMQTEINNLKQG